MKYHLAFFLAWILIGGLLIMSGCAGDSAKDLSKEFEGRFYDRVAAQFSAYCASVAQQGLWINRTRVEAAREIRQRGRHGPRAPAVFRDVRAQRLQAGGDREKVLQQDGPIVRIYCAGDHVPEAVWGELHRYWRD